VGKDTIGASHAVYFLTLEDGREVVARLAIHAEHDLARDLWATEVCRHAGVPAPEALAVRTDRSQGTPFAVLSRLPGRPANDVALSPREREGVFAQMGRHLARIHRIRLAGYGELQAVQRPGAHVPLAARYAGTAPSLFDFVLRGVERTLRELDALRAHPSWPAGALSTASVQRLLACYSREHDLLTLRQAVLVHGDYRLKNALLDGSRVSGIVDYELATAGDPAMDLAWLRFQDVRTDAEWAAVWRGYGAVPDASIECRLLLYELWWTLRRLWWDVMTHDGDETAASLANLDRIVEQLER
jgi:aminoglycoside phosphotransferase (APT) family kinase protein